MLLQKEINQNSIKIEAYQEGELRISGEMYRSPILLTPSKLTIIEPLIDFSALNADLLLSLMPAEAEIALVGSGKNQQFLANSQIKQLNQQGIAIEVMATRQACHTFQILAFENRKVAAFLFP